MLNRREFILSSGVAAFSAPAIVRAETRKTIKPVRAPWDSFWFASYIAQDGLEQLGYTVEKPVIMNAAPMYQAIGQGDLDFTLDGTFPNSQYLFDKIQDAATLLGPTMNPGSVTGYLIDKKTSEEHNIKYIQDFQNPEIAALFSDDGSSKARLVGPAIGLGDEKTAQDNMTRLNLEKTVDLVTGEFSVLVADVVTRYKAGKPVFFYAWYPNLLSIQVRPGIEAVWLVEKGADPARSAENLPGCATGASACNTGWGPTTYRTVANSKWADDNLPAKKFLSSMRFKLEDRVKQNTLMANGEKSEKDLRRHANDWLAANRESFDSWVAAAKG